MSRKYIFTEIFRTLGSILGGLVYAAGMNLIIMPAGLITGGIMGFCQIFNTILTKYLGVDFGSFDMTGIFYYLINLPLLLVAFKKIGKPFFVKTIITVTSITFFMSVIPVHAIFDDILTECIVGGIIVGAGIGWSLMMGASGGGMDIVGILITRKKKDVSVGKVSLAVNVVLYLICLFMFDYKIVIYTLVYAAIHSVAMDRVHIQNINVEVHIITKVDICELENDIFRELGRGVTELKSMGAYTHEEEHLLYVMISKYQLSHLKTLVHKYDPQAFIVAKEGVRVDGHFIKQLD